MSPDVAQMRKARNKKVADDYRKRVALARLRGEPVGPVPAAPIRTRTKALIDLGWSAPAILAAARVDGSTTGLLLIANGHSVRADRKFEPIADLPYSVAVPPWVPDECLVPSLGAARRIRALMALGWRHEDITETIGGRVSHHLAAHKHKRMNAFDWRLVDAAYDALSGTFGGSDLSRRRARAQGFVPPLAWEDIDDPREEHVAAPVCKVRRCAGEVVARGVCRDHYARPTDLDLDRVDRILGGEWRLMCSTADKAEVCRRWVAQGHALVQLEAHTGWATHRYYRKGDAA